MASSRWAQFNFKCRSWVKSDQDAGKKHLTGYGIFWGNKVVEKAWELGDLLWTKYDEKF